MLVEAPEGEHQGPVQRHVVGIQGAGMDLAGEVIGEEAGLRGGHRPRVVANREHATGHDHLGAFGHQPRGTSDPGGVYRAIVVSHQDDVVSRASQAEVHPDTDPAPGARNELRPNGGEVADESGV